MLARSRLLLDARMINIPFRKDRNLIIRETNDRRLYGVAHYVTLLSLLSRAVRVRSKRSYVCTCTLTYSEHTQTRSVVRFWTHVHTYFLSFLLFFKPSFPTTSTITTSTIATTSTISHTFCPPSASSINHPSFARDSPIIRFLSPTVDLFSISPIVPTSPPFVPTVYTRRSFFSALVRFEFYYSNEINSCPRKTTSIRFTVGHTMFYVFAYSQSGKYHPYNRLFVMLPSLSINWSRFHRSSNRFILFPTLLLLRSSLCYYCPFNKCSRVH